MKEVYRKQGGEAMTLNEFLNKLEAMDKIMPAGYLSEALPHLLALVRAGMALWDAGDAIAELEAGRQWRAAVKAVEEEKP